MAIKILNVGESHKHESRHRKTFIVNSMNIAELYLLWKDHKNTPASRPVACANNGFNVQFSNLISPLLEFVADNMARNFEVKSTENSLFKIDQFNISNSEREETEFPFTEPVTISSESQTRTGEREKQFSFAAPDIIGEEEGASDGFDTDEGEFLSAGEQEEEYEADKEITETGDFLKNELVFIGGDVCALYPSSTASTGRAKLHYAKPAPLSRCQLYIQFAMCRLRIAPYYATTGKSLHSTCPSKSRKGLML